MRPGHGAPSGTGVHGGPDHLVLYPTWTGLLASAFTPLLLVLLGMALLGSSDPGPFAWGLLLIGLVTGLLAGRDFPRHVVIGPAGIHRHCLLRTHRLAFAQVQAIERAPGSRLATARSLRSSDPVERARVVGGLLAVGPGRRRWMLTDQPESREEYDHLAALLVAHSGTELRAARPQPGATPTSLYRRRGPGSRLSQERRDR